MNVFTYNAVFRLSDDCKNKAVELFDEIVKFLADTSLGSVVSNHGKKTTVDKIKNYIESSNNGTFSFETDIGTEISYKFSGRNKMYHLIVNGKNPLAWKLDQLTNLLNNTLNIFFAFYYDITYSLWQNEENLMFYTINKKDASHLIIDESVKHFKKVDISKNPGRRTFMYDREIERGYLEAVGSEMWVSDGFFDEFGVNREELKKYAWIKQESLGDGITKIISHDKAFSEEDPQEEKQKILRGILFPYTKESTKHI